MPRLTREESRALTREKLLVAAGNVFAREGLGGASIDRIVEEAGFTKGAFYSNFESKEDIFLQLVESASFSEVSDLELALEGIKDPEEIIDAVCKWATVRSRETGPRMLILDLVRHANQGASLKKQHTEMFTQQWTQVGNALMKIFPAGKAPATPVELGALVLELTFGIAMQFHAGPSAGDLIGLALRGLLKASRSRQRT
ncbi:transcriptional regulator, TetR family [Cupriavidus sp. YR651]|uniref:TetR/AcrR family transcriptional regulator n=1 Tax=Cupriavidus sp. YR651 TaxID=1855315 RepID=UPI0008826711|nr:TetR/AcrR family transcriptional regulator [Cupriavidus sp. YR651]SDE02739.1 transcriptional regulator, TetR family [Cupriavidus sp. YR651]